MGWLNKSIFQHVCHRVHVFLSFFCVFYNAYFIVRHSVCLTRASCLCAPTYLVSVRKNYVAKSVINQAYNLRRGNVRFYFSHYTSAKLFSSSDKYNFFPLILFDSPVSSFNKKKDLLLAEWIIRAAVLAKYCVHFFRGPLQRIFVVPLFLSV